MTSVFVSSSMFALSSIRRIKYRDIVCARRGANKEINVASGLRHKHGGLSSRICSANYHHLHHRTIQGELHCNKRRLPRTSISSLIQACDIEHRWRSQRYVRESSLLRPTSKHKG